jgi:hypothetical protein
MRTIAFVLSAALAACAASPAADPCDGYAIELDASLRVGDVRTIVVTDLETGAPVDATVSDLATPNAGVVRLDRASVTAQTQGATALEVAVGRCREALPVRVD